MIIVFAAAVAVTIGLIVVTAPLACRIGLLDQPGGRKHHRDATPLVGGIAIFCSFMLVVLTLDSPLSHWRSFFLASALVFIIGLLDDFRETPPSMRFVAQAGAALIIVLWGDVRLDTLGFLFGEEKAVTLGWLAIPFSIFCVVGVINATNMIDGLDGLSGGLLLIFFATLLLVSIQAGLIQDSLVLAIICGCLVGFLLFNFPFRNGHPASVFLGDSGALFLGLTTAWFLVRFSQEPLSQLRPITAVWLLGLPIMDTVAIMVRRVRRGRSPFAPDREHLHHILLLAGYPVKTTVLIILGISLVFTFVGLGGEWLHVPEVYMFYGFLLLFGLYSYAMNRAWKLMKALRRMHGHAARCHEKEEGAHV
ncbi:MraY family glycosyltransferase [Thiolapillus brandeum]|uniref:Undecaprenyl-phosphate alpha-N-acetylglucosaminyl 1-phosphate transferase n=1 Tax=Thiolapillus brandeum TaxID=1076588 RepID=A0A7U6GHG0_9GAMM|nr:MraY family glycosyltransferase [Thiolapillus brandeum]BAO43664.1 undecaprenyl-phosphate alpha-N-acetylglucosaminyltransferase [Thiolapillus brandeum]